MVEIFIYDSPDGNDTLYVDVDDDTSAHVRFCVRNTLETHCIEVPREQVKELLARLVAQGWG